MSRRVEENARREIPSPPCTSGYGSGQLHALALLVFGMSSFLALAPEELVGRLFSKLASGMVELWYPQELVVRGGIRVTPRDLLALVPHSRSRLWWSQNSEAVGRALAEQPLISKARVGSCPGTRWGCVEIAIEERTPKYLVFGNSAPWLVGGDGVFMTPLPLKRPIEDEVFDLRERLPGIVLVRGIYDGEPSSDVASARMRYVSWATPQIERESALEIERVVLSPQGELGVTFVKYPYEITFSHAANNPQLLTRESRRLLTVLKNLDPVDGQVAGIDLAFDTLAAVKYKAQAKVGILALKSERERSAPKRVAALPHR